MFFSLTVQLPESRENVSPTRPSGDETPATAAAAAEEKEKAAKEEEEAISKASLAGQLLQQIREWAAF
jgi:hypothetical protein